MDGKTDNKQKRELKTTDCKLQRGNKQSPLMDKREETKKDGHKDHSILCGNDIKTRPKI